MGYTHYWNHDGFTDSEWEQVKQQAPNIIGASSVPVQFEYDESKPYFISDNLLRFNGIDDDGHETFYFPKEGSDREFCKTARKPYDEIVVAMLIMMSRIKPSFSWSSDGDHEDHEDGVNLFNSCIGGM